MNSRETVIRTIRFQGADRLPYDFPGEHGTDFYNASMSPSPDARPASGVDEWGAEWQNLGKTLLGEVKRFPLLDWKDFDRLNVPDIHDPVRWEALQGVREKAGDKFLLCHGISIYERVHFIRGLENTWMDLYEAPRELEKLLDILVEMNMVAIQHYAAAGGDG